MKHAPMRLLTLQLRYEPDVVLARQRAREIARLLRFEGQDQTRLATAVSELARNAFQYAGGGRVEFAVDCTPDGRNALVIRVSDSGPGIGNLDAILSGTYESRTGLGIGLLGARRMVDAFRVESSTDGTTIELGKFLPALASVGAADVAAIGEALARHVAGSPFEEMQQQNQELVRVLDEVRARNAEVERLNSELEETNRGVLALYAELDDRAADLKRASESKSRFLSDVGHELRTPLTSMINLSRLLLDRSDGPLTEEQERQVQLVHRSGLALAELVNDLLDLAKIEAGKTTLRVTDFSAVDLLAGLRGMFRPIVEGSAVALVIEEPTEPILLQTDEGRLSQILRNFVSNALKFTPRGEVRVRATAEASGLVRVDVIDSGVGIAREDQERIFEEFVQVDGPVQRRVTGTGLGLPLSRRLAALLGGRLELVSTPGVGSTFSVIVPRRLSVAEGDAEVASDGRHVPRGVGTGSLLGDAHG